MHYGMQNVVFVPIDMNHTQNAYDITVVALITSCKESTSFVTHMSTQNATIFTVMLCLPSVISL